MSGSRLSEGDPEELIECPFDKAHLLRRKRMQYHIIKCGQNFNKKDFNVCPFNNRHIVRKEEFEAHMLTCNDRGIMEREIYQQTVEDEQRQQGPGYVHMPASSFNPPEPEENWDDSSVVVDVATHSTSQTNSRSLFNSQASAQPHASPAPLSTPQGNEALSTHVREPPQPRMPAINAASAAEVNPVGVVGTEVMEWFKMATSSDNDAARSRGRGRGRGYASKGVSSPPKVGVSSSPQPTVGVNSAPHVGMASQVSPPPGLAKPSGRGRGKLLVFETPVAQSIAAEEEEAAKRKKEKKLKKMYRQILQLEDKVKAGEKLDVDQQAKLGRKEDILSMLKQLHL